MSVHDKPLQPLDLTDDKEVLRQFQQMADLNVIEYILPSSPLGERWVVGLPGPDLINFDGEQARAFLLGASVTATMMARKLGIHL